MAAKAREVAAVFMKAGDIPIGHDQRAMDDTLPKQRGVGKKPGHQVPKLVAGELPEMKRVHVAGGLAVVAAIRG
jgi:hypothetical protein